MGAAPSSDGSSGGHSDPNLGLCAWDVVAQAETSLASKRQKLVGPGQTPIEVFAEAADEVLQRPEWCDRRYALLNPEEVQRLRSHLYTTYKSRMCDAHRALKSQTRRLDRLRKEPELQRHDLGASDAADADGSPTVGDHLVAELRAGGGFWARLLDKLYAGMTMPEARAALQAELGLADSGFRTRLHREKKLAKQHMKHLLEQEP